MTLLLAPHRRFFELDLASRAAVLSFASNASLMVMKIAVGLAFGSVAVLGDGVDSAQDVVASGIAFFTVRLALQPADASHPYGHGKAESLAALSQAALITGGAAFIAFAAARRIADDSTEIYVAASLISMGVTVAVNLLVAGYAFRAARISGSVAIKSDARHLMTNVVQAGFIIAALALVGITGNHIFDPLIAMGLAAYLVWIAFSIFRDALHELIDSSLPVGEVARVEEALAHEQHDGVRGFHALRTRKSGRERYIDLHLLVDPAMTVSEAHHCMEEIEQDVHAVLPGAIVTIHLDPDEPGIMERGPTPGSGEPDTGLHLHRH